MFRSHIIIQKHLLFLICLFALSFCSSAQSQSTNEVEHDTSSLVRKDSVNRLLKYNAAYLELGGSISLGMSINYNFYFFRQEKFRVGARIGGGIAADGFFSAPAGLIGICFETGARAGHFESGFVIAKVFDGGEFFASIPFGYNYQQPGRLFFMRLTFTPIIFSEGIFPLAGISFGSGF